MRLKLLTAAIALSSAGFVQASEFLANDPVEAVTIKDTAFDNAAFLATTDNQISISDSASAGYVNTLFGQKIGLHLGRDAAPYEPASYGDDTGFAPNNDSDINTYAWNNTMGLSDLNGLYEIVDLFWATDLSVGAVGIQLSYGANNFSDRYFTGGVLNFSAGGDDVEWGPVGDTNRQNITGIGDGEIFSPDEVFALDIDDNARAQKSSFIKVGTGIVMNDLPVDGYFNLYIPSVESSASFDYTESYSDSTIAERGTVAISENQSVTSDGGLIMAVGGRYGLSEQLKATGSLFINNGASLNAYRSTETFTYDNDTGTSALDQNETTVDNWDNRLERARTTLQAGAEYRNTAGAVNYVAKASLRYHKDTQTGSWTVVEGSFTDALDSNNNSEAPTGLTYQGQYTETTINAPVHIGLEYSSSATWMWRAGLNADLFRSRSSSTVESFYQPNNAATEFELDEDVSYDNDSSFRVMNSIDSMNFGFTTMPAANVAIDGVLWIDGDLSDWSTELAATVKF